MNEPTLTDTERGTLSGMLPGFGYEWTEMAEEDVFAVLERIVAARVVEAVDRERAAWVAKMADVLARHEVGAFAGVAGACTCDRTWRTNAAHRTHVTAALLAADDTEAGR